jgi:neopullulanase
MKTFKNLLGVVLLATIGIQQLFGQLPEVKKVAPSNWFIGMKNTKLQLLVYGVNIGNSKVTTNYPGINIDKVSSVENPNYLFLDLNIDPETKPGKANFVFSKMVVANNKNKKAKSTSWVYTLSYEFMERSANPLLVTSADFIYLLMPDRFANGDTANDSFKTMADTLCDRNNPFARHGGDLLGVQNKLDYIKELGATCIWMNPVVENDQPQTNEGGTMRAAYHGYGFTDHYQIDRRLGGNEAYKSLINEAHQKGLKVIQDAVYNHAGANHYFIKDLPMKSWLNQWPTYTNTTYRDEPVYDPYASQIDKDEMLKGWFVPFLPDLNQTNPFVKNYLIQHALWTVEYFGIDGWRVDTYMYNDPAFMLACNQALYNEYPNMLITSENAVNHTLPQAYFSMNNLNYAYQGNQTSANDFVLETAMLDALKEKFDWGKGFNKVYFNLAQDAIYKDPMRNMTFLDNHDQDRFFSVIGEDLAKYKLGITMLLTLRGMPSLYYGTEILTKNFKNPTDAEVRKDFPGGWETDATNKFLKENRTKAENDAHTFVKTLANYRKSSKALQSGRFLQFMPKNGVYVYFRIAEGKTVMVALNQNDSAQKIALSRYSEGISTYTTAIDIFKNKKQKIASDLEIPAMGSVVLELGN